MPLRDDRRGRRATIGSGNGPFRTDFGSTSATAAVKPAVAASEAPLDINDVSVNDFGMHHADAGDVRDDYVAADDVRMDQVRRDDACGDDPCGDDARSHKICSDNTRSESIRSQNTRPENTRVDGAVVYSLEQSAVSGGEHDERDERSGSSGIALSEIKAFAKATRDVAQPTTLLAPGDFLMALARPFVGLRAAIIRFAIHPIVRRESGSSHAFAPDYLRANGISGRSFASEVASLLQAPVEFATTLGGHSEASTTLGESATGHAPSDTARSFGPESFESVPASSDTTANEEKPFQAPANLLGRQEKPLPEDALQDSNRERDEPAEAPQAGSGARETRDGSRRNDDEERSPWFDARPYAPVQNGDGLGSRSRTEYEILTAPTTARPERAVPITRLPLRPQGFAITWMTGLPEFVHAASLSRTARHRLLEGLIRSPGTVSSDVVARAYHEEEGDGRPIALRVLLRNFPQAGRAAFVEALRVGSDEERALAVDGLAAIDAREELTPAFSDRVDAIAAKAALAYVGTLERADYRAELSRFIDEAQIEAILNLLAGIVE